MMKFGIQSILWGESTRLDEMLTAIKQVGYDGVELFQHPDSLGGPKRVFDSFHRHGLKLLGMTSGSLTQKLEFVRDYAERLGVPLGDVRAPYVYVDDWQEPQAPEAIGEGYRLAIHPHMFRQIQTVKEAEAVFQRFPANNFPSLLFMPDTAHMTIAGDNPYPAIEKHVGRVEAIHLKDWKSNVGRSYQFYARGFCELGQGSVELKELLIKLVTHLRFNQWLVVEQDTGADPVAVALRSLTWLKENTPRRTIPGM